MLLHLNSNPTLDNNKDNLWLAWLPTFVFQRHRHIAGERTMNSTPLAGCGT